MQVNATLIAAQLAAREARARLAMPQTAPQTVPQPGFAAALEKTAGFSALPLKQIPLAQPAAAAQAPQPAQSGRMGEHLDITV